LTIRNYLINVRHFWLLLLLLCSWELRAGHNIGGEIIYTYLGNNQYEISLIVFKNCEPGTTGFDDPAALGVFETDGGNYYDSFELLLVNSQVEELSADLLNPCNLVPASLCIEKATYTITLTLPPLTGGYTIAYQRCCRAGGIENLAFDQQGMTLVATIPDLTALAGNNSSARFSELPPVTLCRNSEFFFDHSATDPDGDQLTYSFCNPYTGASADFPAPSPPDGPPYNSVSWAGGFNANDPITSTDGFTIDPQTGFLTGTPTALGNYVVGVCVSEYRNGILINTVRRDFQYRVIECESAEPDFPAMADNASFSLCSGLAVTFENLSTASNSTFFHWDFGVIGIENDTSNVAEPTFTFPEPGIYEVVLTSNPGWPCEDTAARYYTVYPPVVPTITNTTTSTYQCINLLDTYDFEVIGDYTNAASIQWNFGSGASPVSSTDNIVGNVAFPSESAQWDVSVTVEENGCVGTDTQTIFNMPDPVASIQPQNIFCQGLEYTFTSNSIGAATLEWDFDGNGTPDLTNPNTPTMLYAQAGTYDVQLIVTAPEACNDTAMSIFEISLLPAPHFNRPIAQCLEGNSFSFQATGAQTLSPSFLWNFGPSASITTSAISAPSGISFDSADMHSVTLTITENGCAVSYTDSVAVAQHILPDFGVATTSGCPGHVANVMAVTESVVPVYYIWDFGNGTTASQSITTHAYELPGSYAITATAFTNEGCYDSLTIVFPNAVTIYPNPDPSFTISPQIMDITNAVCEISAIYQDGDCNFFMSDGGTINDCQTEYSWVEAGIHTITHYVTSPQGCTSSTSGEVIINGSTFYAPTGFTPNDDGLNDYWMPVMTGIASFQMEIFNKWGDVIYSTTDVDRPWMGEAYGGDHYVPNDVYHFRVTTRDLTQKTREFSGSILLTR
jgi:gliding motility-associated-like protein